MRDEPSAQAHYNGAAMAVHWVTALAVVGLLASGLTMASFAEGDPAVMQILPVHASFGLTALVLTLVRIVMRFVKRPPPLPRAMPGWERWAARLSHGAFYVLLVLIPMSGWVVVSVAPDAPVLKYFGLAEIPRLPAPPAGQGAVIAERVMGTHAMLAFVMVGLIGLHVFAALRHAIVLKDGVMARMWPGGRG